MTKQQESYELVERYIAEVGRHLPRNNREDVQKELHTLLLDTIEERKGGDGPISAGIVEEVLEEFGDPTRVARNYSGKPNYLIGPSIYPVFLNVLKIILCGSLGLSLLISVAQVMAGKRQFQDLTSLAGLGGVVDHAITLFISFFIVAIIIFGLIERFGIEDPFDMEKEPWTPSKLPPLEESDQPTFAGTSIKIYATVLIMLLFNFSPDWFGVYFFESGEKTRIVQLEEMGFHFPLLLMNIWWGLALLKNFILLRQKQWSRLTRWIEFGLGLLAIVILGLILVDSQTVTTSPQFVTAIGHDVVAHVLGRTLLISLGIAILVNVGQAGFRLYRLLKPRNVLAMSF